MRILYITPSFQHPAMRGPTRCYHFIKELSQRHQITLLALTSTEVPAVPMQEMAAYTEQIRLFSANGASNTPAAGIFGRVPVVGGSIKHALQRREGVKQMKKAFMELVRRESYDVVLFHGKSIYAVIEDLNGQPLVVDFCDATSMRYQSKMQYAGAAKRLWFALRYQQIKQIESKMIARTPHLAFVSWRDREAALGGNNRGKVVPIGVDHRYWQRQTRQPRPNCLAFTGVMNYAPNEDAALYLIEKILPLVRRSLPDLEVLIVGRDPSPALKEKAQQFKDVTVTGFVDDVRPYLEAAAVFVAPLRYGSGIQNKVLEAMAMEVPVITTSLAAAGLRVDGAGEPPVIVADGEEQFAQRLVALLGQKEERARLATEGRRFVENHFVWSRSAAKLEEMCLAAAGEKVRASR
jgi:glycosyltransferase involved in cell wall biosynthesis